MLKLFHFLHSAETVASFQRFCGIRIIRDLDDDNEGEVCSDDGDDRVCNGGLLTATSSSQQNCTIDECEKMASEDDENLSTLKDDLKISGFEGGRGNNNTNNLRKRNFPNVSSTSTNNNRINCGGDKLNKFNSGSDSPISSLADIDKLLSYYSQHKYEIEVGNLFLYYLFCFATSLGDEIFYISFFPFWFWNIDGYVGRRLCIFWGAFMYLGQATKDILKIPRPTSPPVVKLEKRYSLEYGMPSTHAMVGAGLPFGIYFLTRDRYLFPSMVTLSGAIIWCSVVCLSRIYMGMHTLLDIVGGLLYVFSLMFVCFYFSILDKVDYFVLHASLPSLIVTCLLIPVCLCLFYPLDRNTWSTSRGDTTIIIAVCSGSLISHWLNYNLGQMNPAPAGHFTNHGNETRPILSSPPYPVPPLTMEWALLTASRTLIGLIVLVIVRLIAKGFSLWVLNKIAMRWTGSSGKKDGGGRINYANEVVGGGGDCSGCNSGSGDGVAVVDRKSLMIELPYKFFTYSVLTVCGLVGCPALFKLLYVERETYFTEL